MSLKSLKKKRKMASYALASALVLSNLGFVAPATAASPTPTKDFAPQIEQFKQHLKATSGKKQELKTKLKANLKATDKVRVIVEVEGKTPVEIATEQGKLYKNISPSVKASLTAKVEEQQNTVKAKIKATGVSIKYKNHFSTAFNGFSGEMTFGDMAKLEAVQGVKHVYLAHEYKRPLDEPNMKNSKSYIQTSSTWADAGLKGEGMVVSVIDTGIDPSHKDFKLTDKSKEGLTKTQVNNIIKEKGLKGKFFTDKVPFGYNYFDQNDTIKDSGPNASMHGMHVAGTVAANGNEEKGGIKGVAPEAQLLAMKVFSNDPLFSSTWSDVYLAAIDDSIKLGADVINMSLGSDASFYNEESAEDVAITRATNNGIVCAIAAGNAGDISYGWGKNPFYKNPDIGVVGAPGLNTDSIQVAASGNLSYLYENPFTIDGVDGFTGVGYGVDDWSKLLSADEPLDLVSLNGGFGYPWDYDELDVVGKVVLVKRGDISFADKALIAAEYGAAGIIVYDDGNSTLYKNQGGFDIPFMLISQADGQALEDAIAEGHTSLKIGQSETKVDPEAGRMTEFSSWGTTPSLELKPEITAPGGRIISTLNDNQYGEMSGTSMASPHVAGGSALVQQYLQKDKRFTSLTVSERTHLAKTLLMNTAKVITDVNGQPFSPRRQGAGMMQTYNAVTTPVYVVNKNTGQAKVELKDFTSKDFTMTLTAKNISTKDVTYNVLTDVLADTLQLNDDGENYNALIAGNLKGAKVDGPTTITVPAGKSKDFTIHVDLSKAKVPAIDINGNKTTVALKEDMFVEGFVRLIDADRNKEGKKELSPDLSIPYTGFYGKWDRPAIVDGFKDLGESRFFDLQGMFDYEDEEGNKVEEPVHDMLSDDWFLAPVPDKDFYAFSPNGDWMHDDINVLPALLRNASEVQFNILDKNKKQLRRVKLEEDDYKSYYADGYGMPFSYNWDRAWDGTVKGKTVKDGLYYYQIKSVIDYPGAKFQSKEIPILVDTVEPQLKAKFNQKNSTVTWESKEEGSGVMAYGIFVNGEFVDEVTPDVTKYKLKDLPESAIVDVLAVDNALNFGGVSVPIGDVKDQAPVVIVDDWTTVPYGVYNTKEIPVTGVVQEDLGLKSLTVNGQEVKFNYLGGVYAFSTKVNYEKDGFYDIKVEAVDKSGQATSIVRKVFVDTTVPEIAVDAPKLVAENVKEATLKLNMKDNFNYLSLFVDDNHEFEKAINDPLDVMKAANDSIDVKVPLELGENKFTLKLRDLAGNETVKEVVINRANVAGWKLENDSWYFYKNSSKVTGWLKANNKWYYLGQDGKMQTGWLKDKNQWYFLNKNGDMAVNQWVLYQNQWYYLGSKGTMKVGWIALNGKWYYLNGHGQMSTGWIQLGSKWYYLYNNGQLAVNTTIRGYKLGSDGAWIK
ncbi:S8 family serine peptidase [Neobacillus sp. PS2-9]|uniref:S8 family serine peptidase n=1 Tax=Neobacillus sp. PS2-9 TaxID=3070676 RepID=UPI0027E16155|nr:S8 family serine peptidase [Neobacillus sp. PS2-9]WML59025.1 S8 family serine peptidase [Neobacillus sp. PS2-9]